MTQEKIITVDNITMVSLDSFGRPSAHGKTQIEFVDDRIELRRKQQEQQG